MKRVAAATVRVMLAYWILAADIGGATPVLIPERWPTLAR